MPLDHGHKAQAVALQNGRPVICRLDGHLAMRQYNAGHFNTNGIGYDGPGRQFGDERPLPGQDRKSVV